MTCKVCALFYNLARIYQFVYNKVTSFTISTRYVLVKHGCPDSNKVKIWQTYISPTFWHPGEHGMSVKCEDPIDKLTVQVCLLYHQPWATLNIAFCKRDGITDRQLYGQTNKRTDGRTDRRSLDAPGGLFITLAFPTQRLRQFLCCRLIKISLIQLKISLIW